MTRLPREQVKILVTLDRHHRRGSQLVPIDDVSRKTGLSLDRCSKELMLLKNAGYVEWFFDIRGSAKTQGHILQPGREAVQENYWMAKLETLPAEFITALIPAVVGFVVSPAAWQYIAGALALGTVWRTGIRFFPGR